MAAAQPAWYDAAMHRRFLSMAFQAAAMRTIPAAAVIVLAGCGTPRGGVHLCDTADGSQMLVAEGLQAYRCTVGAHRGASVTHKENTLESIAAAEADDRFEFVEFDVQYTRDDVIVVYHDRLLLRLFGSVRSIGNTDYEELERISEGAITTYHEVMDALTKPVNIEIKSSGDIEQDARLADTIVADLRKRGREKDAMLSSISPEVVKYLGQRYPDIPRGRIFWLTSSTYVHLDALTEGLYREFDSTPAQYLMLHVANLRNIEDLLRLKPPGKTLVFWDFDDTMYIVHKDLGDRTWGASKTGEFLEHMRFLLFRPTPRPDYDQATGDLDWWWSRMSRQ